ncbi:MAG: TadE family protein [Nocardioides sp.]
MRTVAGVLEVGRPPRARPGAVRGERGSSAIEFMLIAPLLVLITMLVVQWVVRLQAERMIDAAAREGAVAAARFNGTPDQGATTARAYLDDLDADVSGVDVTATRGLRTARVEVNGQVLMLIPFFKLTVTATAQQPVEVFTP